MVLWSTVTQWTFNFAANNTFREMLITSLKAESKYEGKNMPLNKRIQTYYFKSILELYTQNFL